ncbi:MAG: phosphoribosyltransferase family protein [Bacteroidota bacterium]
MITLNLANAGNSDIAYKINRFPDGQSGVELTGQMPEEPQPVTIKTRLNSFIDLEILLCATAMLRNQGFKETDVYIPYFLGARSDRAFTENGVNYLKQVICPIINAQHYNSVTTLDPHSDVLEACLNNFRKQDNSVLFEASLAAMNLLPPYDNVCLLAPDNGAVKKVNKTADKFNIKQVSVATKTRDVNGNISNTEIFNLPEADDMRYIIVDDICDGGRTFTNLAQILKAAKPAAKLYLIITHGIFSNGFNALLNNFEQVFTTDSYKAIDTADPALQGRIIQFNIF